MTRGPVLFFAFILSSCIPASNAQVCGEEGLVEYSGAAIATETGDVSFAIDKSCSVFLDGPEQFSQQVARAWAKSTYKGGLRPIAIKVQGKISSSHDDSVAPVLKIERDFFVSEKIDNAEARQQFELRMQRSLK